MARTNLARTIEAALKDAAEPQTPDVCLHFNVINWRTIRPSRDGRLHAVCTCGTHVSRSAFQKEN
jgi:hypothetical protein